MSNNATALLMASVDASVFTGWQTRLRTKSLNIKATTTTSWRRVAFALPRRTTYNHGQMPLSLALAIDITPSMRSELRWELAGVAIGFVLLWIGLAALAVFLFRRRSSDLTLVYFSCFAILYAVRLLFWQSIIRSLFSAGMDAFDRIDLVIDCFIPVTFTLFLLQIIELRWKNALRWVLAAQFAFGVTRLMSTLLHIGEHAMKLGNNIFVIGSCALVSVYYVYGRPARGTSREVKITFAGVAIFALFAIATNLQDLRVLPYQRNIEPIGFLIFVCCLGYVAAHRTLAKEERLLAINKELQIANQIQSSILPREVPRLAGLEIAARYVPMSAVAGDFYDFLVLDERHIGVLVADVTGHGVPAALIASMLKVAFAGQTAHADDPARVLAGLNRALCGKFEEHFVTAAYVFVDLDNLILRYAGAGHPPLLLAPRSNGHARESESREIEANGLMLGLFPEATYTSVEIPLDAGDRLLLYTDGILEAMNTAREEFGKSRLKKFLSASSSSTAHLADSLLLELRRWSGADAGRAQDDDITLLVLDFHPSP
jgi:phosphoserine phosphatase RsbU/P